MTTHSLCKSCTRVHVNHYSFRQMCMHVWEQTGLLVMPCVFTKFSIAFFFFMHFIQIWKGISNLHCSNGHPNQGKWIGYKFISDFFQFYWIEYRCFAPSFKHVGLQEKRIFINYCNFKLKTNGFNMLHWFTTRLS